MAFLPLPFTITAVGPKMYYKACSACNKSSSTPGSSECERCGGEMRHQFRLNCTASLGPRHLELCIFDRVASRIMGCDASGFYAAERQAPGVIDLARNVMIGADVFLVTKPPSGGRSSSSSSSSSSSGHKDLVVQAIQFADWPPGQTVVERITGCLPRPTASRTTTTTTTTSSSSSSGGGGRRGGAQASGTVSSHGTSEKFPDKPVPIRRKPRKPPPPPPRWTAAPTATDKREGGKTGKRKR